jgi:hypothetical protein
MDTVAKWEQYREEKDEQSLVFVGDGARNAGEFLTVPYSHRFTDEYTRMQYAQMMDFCRGAVDEYDDPHVVLLALTGSTTTPAGEMRAPFDHMDELLSSWDRGVRYELNHVMEADRKKDDYEAMEWEYLQIREPTTEAGDVPGGYLHIHPVIVCDGHPGRKRFERVIDKHVEKCELALPEGHEYDTSIQVMEADEIANLGAYLFKYLGKSWTGEYEPHQRRFNAMLWESGRRRFQPSEGAQRWMRREEGSDGGSYRFVGVGQNEKVAELAEYDDVGDFRIDKEVGVGEWLNEREQREAVGMARSVGEGDGHVWMWDREECRESEEHEFRNGECVNCGVPIGAFVKGVAG